MKTIMRNIAIIGLLLAIVGSGYFALKMQRGYSAEEAAHQEASVYRPVAPEGPEGEEEAFVNQGILDLQQEYPDAVGWITIPFTGIDYPFVQAEDNRHYLDKDMDGAYSMAGTLFMDCQSSSDFSDFNTIIYGHHMKNGTMFGPLARYEKADFFHTNTGGTVFLADRTIELDFFAYMVLKADDLTVYESPENKADKEAYFDYITENARHFREVGVGGEDRVVTLSTCAYEFKDARMLLIGRQIRP